MESYCAIGAHLKRELSAAIAMTMDCHVPKEDDPTFVERRDAHRRVINTRCAVELHILGCPRCSRSLEVGRYAGDDA
jgi:hypothetical protein